MLCKPITLSSRQQCLDRHPPTAIPQQLLIPFLQHSITNEVELPETHSYTYLLDILNTIPIVKSQ